VSGRFERWYPFYFCWLGGIVALLLWRHVDLEDDQRLALLQSLISAAAILSGFMGTALTVVLGFSDRRIMRLLRQYGHDVLLVRFMYTSIVGLLLVVACSLLAICTPWKSSCLDYFLAFLLGTSVGFSVLALVRLHRPLQNILSRANEQDPPGPGRPST